MALAETLYTSVAHEDGGHQETSEDTHRVGPNLLKSSEVSMTQKEDLKGRYFRGRLLGLYKRGLAFLPHWLPILMTAVLATGISLLTITPVFGWNSLICNREGVFNLKWDDYDTYNPWKSSEIFAINLSFGSVPFATAKLIDVSWDLGAGRGGQAVLAVISYKIYTKSVSRIMQTEYVSSGTFEAITLQSGTFTALMKLVKDFITNSSIRSRVTISWMILSATFVLMFSTVLSAMTGYSAVIQPFLITETGQMILAQDFKSVVYIIHDGARLGPPFYDEYPVVDNRTGSLIMPDLTDNYKLSFPPESSKDFDLMQSIRSQYIPGCSSYAPGRYDPKTNTRSIQWRPELVENQECDLLWHISEYTDQYGFMGLHNESSVLSYGGANFTIPGPALSIEAYVAQQQPVDREPYIFDDSWAWFPNSIGWQNLETNSTTPPSFPFNSANRAKFAAGNVIYDQSQMNQRGRCQQQGTGSIGPISYQWGFSFAIGVVFLGFSLVWVIGMYVLHLDALFNLRPAIERRNLGIQRAVIDLAGEYGERLSGLDIKLHGDRDLKAHLKHSNVSYQDMSVCASENTRWPIFRDSLRARNVFSPIWFERESFKQWSINEKWWLTVSFVLIVSCVVVLTCGPSSLFGPAIMSTSAPAGTAFSLLWARRKRIRLSIVSLFLYPTLVTNLLYWL